MLNFRVIPGVGIGHIRFGFTRQEVKQAFGTEPEAVLPRDSEGHEKQAFYFEGTFTMEYSDKDSTVEWIAVSRNGPFKVTYNEIDLFALEVEELVNLISKETPFDKNNPLLGYSYIFPELEMALWRPSMPKDFEGDEELEGSKVWFEEDLKKSKFSETISLGIKGYYTNNPAY
jgi:uncharacterized protein YkuJ